MTISVDALWGMGDVELLAVYHEALRLYAEKKFARDTERGRLHWLRAKAFAQGAGGVTERTNAVEAAEDLARKGQQVRELTRDLDLVKADVDVIAACLRLKNQHGVAPKPAETALQDDDEGAAE